MGSFQDGAFKAGAVMQDPFSGALGLGMMGDKGRNFLGGIPFVGGMFKGLFGDPEQEAMQRAMKEAQQQMAKMREYQMGGRMNAMNQGALAFGPRNQMLGEMMGKGPNSQAMDLAPMLQNPMTAAHQASIRDAAFGGTPNTAPTNAPPGQGGAPAVAGGGFSGIGKKDPYGRY
jgi:hypothetical protein